jgi:hypothetical protein
VGFPFQATRDISVSKLTDRDSILGRSWYFTRHRVPQPLILQVRRVPSPGIKRPEHEPDHSFPSRIEVKKAYGSIHPLLPYVSRVCNLSTKQTFPNVPPDAETTRLKVYKYWTTRYFIVHWKVNMRTETKQCFASVAMCPQSSLHIFSIYPSI